MSSTTSIFSDTSRAFDSVADEYDGSLGNNALIQRMRQRVISRIVAAFPPGSRLLDLGCGTGIDAVDLASRGYNVVAIDSSRRMVERTRSRIAQARFENRANVIHLGIHELEQLHEGPFDGLYSNFGPLNCVPDLGLASREMARLLKPRGRIVASVIGNYCPWEVALYFSRFNFRRAFARLSHQVVPVTLRQETIWTRYYTPGEFLHAFASDYELVAFRSLNLFLPPPYLVHAYEQHRQIFRPLAYLDDRLCAVPFLRNFGDHFMIELQKRS